MIGTLTHRVLEHAAHIERAGLPHLRAQLEDASFPLLDPEGHASLLEKLPLRPEASARQLDALLEDTRGLMDAHAWTGEVTGRVKSLYSLHKKLQRKGIEVGQVRDLTAVRVVVPTVADCYDVMGALEARHHPLRGTFKDYITDPKPNGYQSLHLSMHTRSDIRPEGVFEVQVRTRAMHEHAERGGAAHWMYKLA
jgi:GTP pyrophosphokinase